MRTSTKSWELRSAKQRYSAGKRRWRPKTAKPPLGGCQKAVWWTWSGSNRRPLPCHSGGLLKQKNLQELRELPTTCKYLKARRGRNQLGLELGLVTTPSPDRRSETTSFEIADGLI